MHSSYFHVLKFNLFHYIIIVNFKIKYHNKDVNSQYIKNKTFEINFLVLIFEQILELES